MLNGRTFPLPSTEAAVVASAAVLLAALKGPPYSPKGPPCRL
jgi:hypothetical protein